MTNSRDHQEGGTRAVLNMGGTKTKLDSIVTRKGAPANTDANEKEEDTQTPKRVKKTISISFETVLAIKKIQAERLRKEGKQPNDSAVIDEAVRDLLHGSGLTL